MNNKLMDSFIASNKVIRHKLGVTAADILAELYSKYTYWGNKNQLQDKDGTLYFFTSLNDLKSETGYSKNVISKHIKVLKKHGLVKSIRQGLNKPNLYSVNINAINSFITKHENSYKEWQSIEREDNLSSSSNTRKSTNDDSGNYKKGIQELSNKCATNNLNTNNESTNTFLTNRASSANEINIEEELIELIEDIRSIPVIQSEQSIESLFKFLCGLVPIFENFNMSEEDKALLEVIVFSEIEVYKFSSKIVSNAIKINNGHKDVRFGNLFVGVREMIINYKNLYEDER